MIEGRRDGELMGAVTFNSNRAWLDYRRQLAGSLAEG